MRIGSLSVLCLYLGVSSQRSRIWLCCCNYSIGEFRSVTSWVKAFFKKDHELPFLEINDECLRYRSIAEFGVSAVKNSEIEFVIIGGDHIEIAQKGFGGVISIQYQGTTPDDLSLLFNKVAPQATVKIRIEAEED